MRIVTHGGQAHADEVMAIALVLMEEGKKTEHGVALSPYAVDIIRTVEDKRAREFDADFVIDVGRDHDPRKNWFDHHQFPREAAPACAFTLVARKYGVDLAGFAWAEKMAVMDSKGPKEWFMKVARRSPEGYDEIRRLEADSFFSYLAVAANKDFRVAVRMAMNFLETEFEEAEATRAAVRAAMERLRVVDFDGSPLKMAYFETTDPRGTLAAADKVASEDKAVVIAGMRDNRGGGYSAVRLMDHPLVDFTPRSGEPGCVFAHATGFCLKWEESWDGFLDAVSRSIKR